MPNTPASLLLVVTDETLTARLRACLSSRPWRLTWALPSGDALAMASTGSYDAIVIGAATLSADVMNLVRRVKAHAPDVEVVARSEERRVGRGGRTRGWWVPGDE